MAKKKPINERCPFWSECERKKCEFTYREAKCPYYSANEMPGCEIKDQKQPFHDMFDEQEDEE